MSTEDIDDLFRQELAGHATPPGEALWARLQADETATAADQAAERLDGLFQKGLNTYATAPGRELWERLEDEHLRPRKRRPAAWWPMAMAAAVAVLLIAGGVGLWLGFPTTASRGGLVVTHLPAAKVPGSKPTRRASAGSDVTTLGNKRPGLQSTTTGPQAAEVAFSPLAQKNKAGQATRSTGLASSAPKAKTFTAEQLTSHLKQANRKPDAATEKPTLVARTTAPVATPKPLRSAPDEARHPQEAPDLALVPKPAPMAEPLPTDVASAPALASAGELITVDVRNGEAPLVRSARAGAVAEAQAERRPLGARLLHQAGHLMRGERLSLSEVTGLPENVTVRATIGGRSLTKSIQL